MLLYISSMEYSITSAGEMQSFPEKTLDILAISGYTEDRIFFYGGLYETLALYPHGTGADGPAIRLRPCCS